MGNILSYFFPEPADDSIEQVIVDKHEEGDVGRYKEGLPVEPAVEDVVMIVDEKVHSAADLVNEKELEEGFEVVEDNKFDAEIIEVLTSNFQTSGTMASEKPDQPFCQDNKDFVGEVETIGSLKEMAEEFLDEIDNESDDSQTIPDIETDYSFPTQPRKDQMPASMVSSSLIRENPTYEISETLRVESSNNSTESPELQLLTSEYPKDLTHEAIKAIAPEPSVSAPNESPEFQLSGPCQVFPSEPSNHASNLATPAYEPEIVDNTADADQLVESLASPMTAKPKMKDHSPDTVTAVDESSKDVEVNKANTDGIV